MQVSKGTYIRSLVHDIGQDLGCGAYVDALNRSAVGDATLDDAYTLDALESAFKDGSLRVLNVADMLGFQTANADDKMLKRVKNGSSLRNNSA